MPWDYTTAESITVPSTTSVNVDRVVCSTLMIRFDDKAIVLELDRGVINGSGVDAKDTLVYVPGSSTYDTIMAALTNNGESLGDALERILLSQANSDGDLPAGSVS